MKNQFKVFGSSAVRLVLGLLTVLLFSFRIATAEGDSFQFKIDVPALSFGDAFAFEVYDTEDFEVRWGNNDWEGIPNKEGYQKVSRASLPPGVNTISVRGEASRISFYTGFGGTQGRLIDVLTPIDEGVEGITSAREMFRGAVNITTFTAANFFDVASSSVTDMHGMFRGATNFNGDISSWDVSRVADMSYMFRDAVSFDGELNGWGIVFYRPSKYLLPLLMFKAGFVVDLTI